MSYRSKFTQDEFNAHHKEFIQNYATKYRTMDLDFKMVMFMRGCTDGEFSDKMDELQNPKPKNVTCSYSGLPSTESYGWVDEDNSEYDSFSDGKDNKSYGGDDSNEY